MMYWTDKTWLDNAWWMYFAETQLTCTFWGDTMRLSAVNFLLNVIRWSIPFN